MPLSRWEGTLSVRSIQAPASAVRSPGWGFFRLSGGRARPATGPLRRSGGSSSPGPVLTASGGRRCASPWGPAQGCSSPGRPLRPRQEPGGRGPSSRPQLQLVFVASSRSTACPWLAALWFARGWGDRLLRGCTHLQRPGFSPGMHRPPQVAKSGGENARPLLLLLGAPGVGGGEAGEQQQPRRLQRAVEARVQPRGPRRREITSPGGAGRMWARPGEWCTGRSSSGAAAEPARAGLSRAHGPRRRAGAPGASALSRLARAGASPRLGPGCRAPRPTSGVPCSSPPPGAARSLSAEPPARLSCSLLRSGPTDRR